MYTCFTHTDKDVQTILASADATFGHIKKTLADSAIDASLKCPVRQIGFRRLV
jgi:ferredoxin